MGTIYKFRETENLSTNTSRRRSRRSRNTNNATTNLPTNPSTNLPTTTTPFNWAPAGSANTRSRADIVRNPETRSSNRDTTSNMTNRTSDWDILNGISTNRNRRPNQRNTRQSPILNTHANRIIRTTRVTYKLLLIILYIQHLENYTLSREQINSVLTTSQWRDYSINIRSNSLSNNTNSYSGR